MKDCCARCPVLTTGFFAALKGPSQDRLLCLFTYGRYRKRHVLFQEGNPAVRVFAVRSGLVKLYQASAAGRLQLVSVVQPGEVFGLEALTSGAYETSAEVLADAELCFFESAAFAALLRGNPALSLEIVRILTQNLRECRAKLVGFGTKTAAARLAAFLLGLLPSGGSEIDLPLSRGEVAGLIGTRLETVSRLLASFKRRRVLAVRGHRVRVLDRSRLEAAAA